jgi:hypothetical protein
MHKMNKMENGKLMSLLKIWLFILPFSKPDIDRSQQAVSAYFQGVTNICPLDPDPNCIRIQSGYGFTTLENN